MTIPAGPPISIQTLRNEYYSGGGPTNLAAYSTFLGKTTGQQASLSEYYGKTNPIGVVALDSYVAGTYSLTVPNGINRALLSGAGAGGGAGGGNGATGGGGGGSGAYLNQSSATVVAGHNLSVQIGAAGTGGAIWGGSGTAGGQTSFYESGVQWYCRLNGGDGAPTLYGAAGGTVASNEMGGSVGNGVAGGNSNGFFAQGGTLSFSEPHAQSGNWGSGGNGSSYTGNGAPGVVGFGRVKWNQV